MAAARVAFSEASPAASAAIRYHMHVDFDEAMESGELDRARTYLDAYAELPGHDRFALYEGYGELARVLDRAGRHDDAIAAMELAIEHGWRSVPDPRSDIAEFHLRAGRHEQAAAIWAALKEEMPKDVWLYNAAGLCYGEVKEHQFAVGWLGEGIEVAMHSGDPEGLVAQLSDVRRHNLEALGREYDELEQRVGPFLQQWVETKPSVGRSALPDAIEADRLVDDTRPLPGSPAGGIAVAVSWFPRGEYEAALARWPDLAELWAGVPHDEYSRRMDGNIKWMRAHGLLVRSVSPIAVDDYTAWCDANDEDPVEARASYAAHRLSEGDVIAWPPGRNEPCWCGSKRKYKKCCGSAPAAPMRDEQAT